MVKLQKFYPAMAPVLGETKGALRNYVDPLRGNGQINSGPRGLGAPDMSVEDAAALLLAWLGQAPKNGPEFVGRTSTFRCCDYGYSIGTSLFKLLGLTGSHTIKELIVALLNNYEAIQSAVLNDFEVFVEEDSEFLSKRHRLHEANKRIRVQHKLHFSVKYLRPKDEFKLSYGVIFLSHGGREVSRRIEEMIYRQTANSIFIPSSDATVAAAFGLITIKQTAEVLRT
jgi:hypothetical protein